MISAGTLHLFTCIINDNTSQEGGKADPGGIYIISKSIFQGFTYIINCFTTFSAPRRVVKQIQGELT